MVKVIRKNLTGSSAKEERTQTLLKKMREVSIEEHASMLAMAYDLPYIDLHVFPAGTEDILLVPEADAKKFSLALFDKKTLLARFAILDPANQETLGYIKALAEKHGWEAKIYVVSEPSMQHAWENYAKRTFIDSLDLVRVALGDSDLEKFEKDLGELMSTKESRSLNTSRAMEIILAGARKLHASDVHLEPEEESIRLRYRIDGVLQEIGRLPLEVYRLLISRIKMISKMRLNIRKEAQDGHFFVDLDSKRIDIRVSSIPGKHGESINMRLLSGDDVIVDVGALGLRGLAHDDVMKQVAKPNGLILNTGPTGSGKTTTLYSILSKLNTPTVKVITVEDPIEYQIPGILQTQTKESEGYTFATALRSLMRQNPDILMVGEIRDEETAQVAVQSSNTGHLVLSTIHANSAAGVVPRLTAMGVPNDDLANAANLFIAQRLVRKICQKCKTFAAPTAAEKEIIEKTLQSLPNKNTLTKKISLARGKGCASCSGTGFAGQMVISETLLVNREISELIAHGALVSEIEEKAVALGMITMTQDGILSVLEGETTLAEVQRVTDL